MNWDGLGFAALFLFCFTYTVVGLIWRLNHHFVEADAQRREREAPRRWQATEVRSLRDFSMGKGLLGSDVRATRQEGADDE